MKKNTRGASYPVMDLETALQKTQKILDAVGKAPNSKLVIMQAIGYSGDSGPSRRALAALIQYDLLMKVRQDFQVSGSALKFLFPETNDEKLEALIEIVHAPPLFAALIERYSGDKLPTMLANTLVSQFGINPKSGNDAAEIFRRSVMYAGLVDNEGILNDLLRMPADQDEGSDRTETTENLNNNKLSDQTANMSNSNLKRLPSGIEIAFPQLFDFAVLVGEFGPEIMQLEKKAQEILKDAKKGSSDEENGITKT